MTIMNGVLTQKICLNKERG